MESSDDDTNQEAVSLYLVVNLCLDNNKSRVFKDSGSKALNTGSVAIHSVISDVAAMCHSETISDLRYSVLKKWKWCARRFRYIVWFWQLLKQSLASVVSCRQVQTWRRYSYSLTTSTSDFREVLRILMMWEAVWLPSVRYESPK